ncbi:PREDICTED: high mobility group protein B2-like [Buceros rhinoceros silvestris]|uniref:high mobility group protein B2-like n=1 Tax=Buceros rhinoceros silvestris TaxID=175836 RepID=UPI00052891A3|nr:PREDICTED: high mobility group protein B2-like [Buceros rhinoceros silvestris]
MAWPARKPQGRKSAAAVVVYIFMQITVASQEPATSRALSKRVSKNQKTTSKVKGKEHEETTKTKLPDPLRGVRKTQKKRPRRVKFNVVNKPLPAFFLFMVQHRPRLQKRVPHWTQVMIVEKLAEMWHNQPEKRKEMYKDHAAWLRKKTGVRA